MIYRIFETETPTSEIFRTKITSNTQAELYSEQVDGCESPIIWGEAEDLRLLAELLIRTAEELEKGL